MEMKTWEAYLSLSINSIKFKFKSYPAISTFKYKSGQKCM